MLDQVRVVTISRLGKKASWLIKEEMKKIDLALHIALGIENCPSK
jgi:mRNA-degrading endonuclease toxin of MazEF toxin-antitoxin module